VTVRDMIFIGIGGYAVALDRATGSEVWRTKLRGSDFVNVAVEGRDVFASTRGRLYCIDATTGTIKWENELKGLGWGLVGIAGTGAVTAAEARRREQAAHSAAATS
jgi:outer membrane protein assembly factor BamB